MPNPKGNLDWKPKYGETTKVVRLPESLADNVTALLKQEVSAIDVLQQLESVPLLHRSQLPSVAAVYLVYQSDRLLYIGRTENLKQRWSQHHRQNQFAELEDVRIAWFPCTEDAPLLESTLIELLEPEFNGQKQTGDRVQVLFRWNSEKLKQLKDWAASERLTLQEVLEALAARFLECPDSSLITENKSSLPTNTLIAEVIARLEQVEKTVNHLAPIQDRFAALESELGELSA